MSKRPPKHHDPEQSKRFVEMAKEVEADESTEAFKKVTKKDAKPKPPNVSPGKLGCK